MGDYIIRAIAADGSVRAFAADTTNLVSEAKKIHNLSPIASVALGRLLTGTALMSKMLKGANDTLTLQIKGNGPLEGMVAVSDSEANVRGYVYNPDVKLLINNAGKFDIAKSVGKGYVNVIKDMGLKEPYIGFVNLISGEIAEDIAYYFAFSEQIPSVVSLGVLVDSDESILNSGGFIIQLMPEADEDVIKYLEEKINQIPSITSMLSQGKSPEDILELILGEKGLRILEKGSCSFACNCSRDRMERNILSLGRDEIMELIQEQHGAEAQCHFCNNKYWFSEEELRNLISQENE